jgi:hypothetical protein
LTARFDSDRRARLQARRLRSWTFCSSEEGSREPLHGNATSFSLYASRCRCSPSLGVGVTM